ncbi:hypothetical protein ACLB2K_020332 [Fragaria x ananassa]
MDSNYTAKLVYSGEGAAVSFDHSVSYIDFANSLCDRFPMMFRVLARYSSDFVDVDVCSFDRKQRAIVAKRYCSKGWENYIKSKDQKFHSGVEEFRLKLRMYTIEMGFEYNTDLVNKHSCHGVVRLQTNKMMGSKIIKSIMLDKVRENPNKKAIDIYHEIKSDYGMDVSYRTAWYGKERVRESVLGGDADSYAQLVWFGQKAVESNPGSTIKIEYEPETRRFERIFVCYDAWMKGFQFCRPIMFIDSTFISNKYRGKLIGAFAKDANQCTF